jgi:hypothetical protein
MLHNVCDRPEEPLEPAVEGVGALTYTLTDFAPTVASPEHSVHLEFASFPQFPQPLFKSLNIQIRLVPSLGIGGIPDQCVFSVLFETIQRQIQGEVLACARIFKTVRRSLRGSVHAKAWVTAEVLPMFVP